MKVRNKLAGARATQEDGEMGLESEESKESKQCHSETITVRILWVSCTTVSILV